MSQSAPRVPPWENRRHPRHSSGVSASLAIDGATHPCKIENFSLGGVAVSTDARPEFRQTVTLSLDTVGSFPGTVVHSTEGFVGILLDGDDAELSRLTQHLAQFD